MIDVDKKAVQTQMNRLFKKLVSVRADVKDIILENLREHLDACEEWIDDELLNSDQEKQ